jgi:hypothetical protein
LLAAIAVVALVVVRQPALAGLSPLMPTDPAARRHLVVQRLLAVGFLAAFVAWLALSPDHLSTLIGGGGILGVGRMIIDAQCVLSDAQAITVTAVSTNTYDTGAAGNSLEVGEPMCIAFSVDVAAVTTTGDETYQFQVIQSANADLSAQDVLVQTDTALITRAVLVAGYRFYLPIPPGLKSKRYIGARYVTGGNADRAISVTAYIQPLSMIQNDKTYASGFAVNS